MTALPTHCRTCGVKLLPHNLTGVCLECRFVRRQERLAANAAAAQEDARRRERRQWAVALRIRELCGESMA